MKRNLQKRLVRGFIRIPMAVFAIIVFSQIFDLIAAEEHIDPNAVRPPEIPQIRGDYLQDGMAAAKEKDWVRAANSFEEARLADPSNPSIWFNEGLANAKISGKELSAIFLMQGFLALQPESDKAATIQKLIQELKTKSRLSALKLLALKKDMLLKTPRKTFENSGNGGEIPTVVLFVSETS